MDIYHHLKQLRSAKALVIGDFMLDVYTMGSVQRISPEAPVPILHVTEETRRPGGAGNAILNLVSLGMEVIAVGRVGNDQGGHDFIERIAEKNVNIEGIEIDFSFKTPIKTRMIADTQQLLRVDYESLTPLSLELEEKIMDHFPRWLKQVQVVAISDYAKGFLTPSFLKKIITLSNEAGIPVIVDPKGMDFSKYHGATIIKPNLKEAIAAAGLSHDTPLDLIGRKILNDNNIQTLMVTRSKEGISIFHREEGRTDFPVNVHEVKDVTGAGDTVLAVITTVIANQLDLKVGAALANVAAGIAIERLGCARISLHEIEERLKHILHCG